MARQIDGPDRDRVPGPRRLRTGRSRSGSEPPPKRSWLGLERSECPAWWRSSSPSLQDERIPVGGFGAWRGNREEEPVILFAVATRLMLACTLILDYVHVLKIKLR